MIGSSLPGQTSSAQIFLTRSPRRENSMSEIQELELYEVPEQGASAQPAELFEGLAIQPAESTPRRAATKWPPQQAAKADPKSKPQVDADGHRIVLIDDEIFTVVEG